jgi:hypothetical protein
VYEFIEYTLTILTTDYQYIEAVLMCSFIIMVIVSIIAMNEIADKLCNSIMKLKEDCKQKDIRIAALQAEVAMLTDKSVTSNDNVISDNVISDNVINDNVISDNVISDNVISDNVISDNVISDNVISDNVISDNYTIEGAFLN